MLNYAENMSIRPTVPGTQPLQHHCQEYAPDPLISMLSTLIAHPEFQQGVRNCQDYYFDLYDEAPLTEEAMICEVEMNLSRMMIEADKQSTALLGESAAPYLEKLGWVVGTIAKGLTYTNGPGE